MGYGRQDLELEESTNRWMAWGVVLLLLFVLAFPAYWLTQPSRLEAAQASFDESLSAHGEVLYSESCAQCHGFEARGGIGPALNSEQFLGSVTNKQMHQLISTGVPGTLMSPYSADFGGPFTQQQITSIVAYLRSFEDTAPDFAAWHSPLSQADLSGDEMYNIACSFCHGIDLEGNIGPPLGPGSDASFEDDAFLFERIHDGIDEMPAFGNVFTDPQIDDIIEYIREVQDA